MRILIMGGSGMLGHRLLLHLRERHEVRCTLRQSLSAYQDGSIFSQDNSFDEVDARSDAALLRVLAQFRPEVVVNCVGIVKQRDEAKQRLTSIEINALLPHRLAVMCEAVGARLVHLSTDCVFSGNKGRYEESDPPDPVDDYGRTKLLGEVANEHCITLRTSIIGRELFRTSGLLEWFLSESGTVRGFERAIYTGFTTHEMSRIIEMVIRSNPWHHGIYQVASEPIAKYELLRLIKKELDLNIDIVRDTDFQCDRSLLAHRFNQDFGYQPPSWTWMVKELREG